MKILHTGFDWLDISFKGKLSAEILDKLKKAKEQAKATPNSQGETIKLCYGVDAIVKPTGAKGGYNYCFKIGDLNIFAKDCQSGEWHVRVSVPSDVFVCHTYNEAKILVLELMEKLGLTDFQESIGRVDYALDFIDPSFKLDPQAFVIHHNSTVRTFREQTQDFFCAGECTGVTIGKMPNRQIAFYNKSKDTVQKKKLYWFEKWGIKKEELKSPVWRVEVRAGKKYLKETLRITTFKDLEAKICDSFYHCFKKVRMLEVTREKATDSNVTRLHSHTIWQTVKNKMKCIFEDTFTGLEPSRVKEVKHEELTKCLDNMITGTLITYAEVMGCKHEELSEFIYNIMEHTNKKIENDPSKTAKKMRKARDKYIFIEPQQAKLVA